MIKRYDLGRDRYCDEDCMMEDPNGEYVRYEDVEEYVQDRIADYCDSLLNLIDKNAVSKTDLATYLKIKLGCKPKNCR